MGAAAIKAGEAFVRIFSDDSDLIRGLKGLEGKFARLGGQVQSVGKGIAAAGAGIAGIGAAITAPFAAGVAQFVEAGDALNKMAARTGLTAQALSELGFAAEQSGASLTDVESAVKRMQRAVTELGDGSQSMVDTFAALGLTMEDLAGLSPDQQFQRISAAIAAIEDPTTRAARAMEVFGKSGTNLLPLITSDIAALRKEADELGITLGTDDAQAAADLGDAMNRVGRTIKATFIQLGAAVAEPLTVVVNKVAEITSAIANWVKNNKAITATIAAIGAGFVAAGTVIATVGGGVIAVGAAISAIVPVVTAIAGAVTAIGAPVLGTIATVGAIVAGVTAGVIALGAGFAYVANEAGLLMPAIEFIRSGFGKLFSTFGQVFGGMVSALGGGEFGKAAQIAWAGVQLATLQGAQHVIRGITYLWKNAGVITSKFFFAVVQTVQKVFSQIPKIAWQALRGGTSFIEAMSQTLAEAFSGADLASGLDPAIARAQAKLDSLTMTVKPAEPKLQPAGPALQPQVAAGLAEVMAPQMTATPSVMAQAPQFMDPAMDPAEAQARHFARLEGIDIPETRQSVQPQTVNAAAQAPINTGSADASELGQLLLTAQQQLRVLRSIEQGGGLG